MALGDRFAMVFCYFWRLPTPRQLGAVEESWQELVIVLGHHPVIVRGSCAFPGRAPKATLVDCAWLVDPHLVLVVRHPIVG